MVRLIGSLDLDFTEILVNINITNFTNLFACRYKLALKYFLQC